MTRILLAALLSAALFTTPASAAKPPLRTGGAAPPDAVPGELLVRFKSSAGGSERAQARRAAKVQAKLAMRLSGAQLVKAEEGQSVKAAIAALERSPHVMYAEPNWIFRAASTTPNDTDFGSLWGLHNTGQSIEGVFGVADADIDAVEAWDRFKAAPSTVVAVADTGVRYDHPDLDGNIWSNPAETANGIDDGDPGSLVDDVRGWDFIDNDNDPTDLQEHGTHVAGTIAAEGDNAFGISGVAWDAQIMPVRVLNEDGSGSYQAIADGFDYAGDMGAKVLNASLGGGGDDATGSFFGSIIAQHPNTLYVVAAGNESNNNETAARYPCNTPGANLVCVAATDNNDALAGFSNYGSTQVDLGAPGVSILSTVPKVTQTGFSDDFDTGLDGWTNSGTGGVYTTWTFTGYSGGSFLTESLTDTSYSFSNNENLTLTSPAYNLAGRTGCVLAYDMYHDYDEGVDFMYVETSTNGTNWTVRESYTGNNGDFRALRTNLKADGQTVFVRFHTDADGTAGAVPAGGWFGSAIDNVRVTCADTPDASSFSFFNGTSMATPKVAGAATLLFGAKPSATVADVRGWLLSSGDAIPALAGITVTGKRLNLNSAFAAAGISTPPTATTVAADAISASGATLKGTVDPNGTATTYHFEYGTAADALTTDIPAVPASAGSGDTPVSVSQPLTGLNPATTYFYRVVATQSGIEYPGSTLSFTTLAAIDGLAPPSVQMGAVTGLGSTVATLSATVNPNGKATTFHFQYRKSGEAYGVRQTPDVALGAGNSPVGIQSGLADLSPSTQYFYRLRATNADGTTTAAESTFTTTSAPVGPAGPEGPQGPAGQNGTNGTNGVDGTNGIDGSPGAPGAPGANGVNGATGAPGPAGPAGPAGAPGAKGLVTCKVSKSKKAPKVTCKVTYSTAAKASVRISRAGRLVARGSAKRLTKGRSVRMSTLRPVARGRYKLQVTLVERGVKTTLTASIRL